MNKIVIIYGSQTGTAENLAQDLQRQAIQRDLHAQIYSANEFNIKNLPNEKIIVFIISTTGQGEPPTNMKKFWQFLLISNLPSDSLKNVNFAIFGLGDSSYQQFNAMARKLHVRLLQLGAKSIIDKGLGDDQHPQGFRAEYDKWIKNLWKSLFQFFPQNEILKSEVDTFSNKTHISKYIIQFINQNNQEYESLCNDKSIKDEYLDKLNQYKDQDKNIHQFPLMKKIRLTPDNYEKETYKFDFSLQNINLKYNPGQVLIIYPKNSLVLCQQLADILKLDLQCYVRISLNNQHPLYSQCQSLLYPKVIKLLDLFQQWLNIGATPDRYFLQLLSYCVTNDMHKEKLIEMCSPNQEGQREYYKYIVKEKRNVYEILFDFNSFNILPLEYILESINIIKPRLYSISSSQLIDFKQISITVNVIKYLTEFKRKISGICSTWLAQLEESQTIEAQIGYSTLEFPKDNNIPALLIATGTGIAPFISFLQERQASSDSQKQVKNNVFLVYGCRSKDSDYFYKDMLEQLVTLNRLTLFTAFSREQKEKIYVQNQIQLNGQQIADFIIYNIKDIKIMIVGQSKNMPTQVENVIVQIISQYCNKTIPEAQQLITKLKNNRQLQIESW